MHIDVDDIYSRCRFPDRSNAYLVTPNFALIWNMKANAEHERLLRHVFQKAFVPIVPSETRVGSRSTVVAFPKVS